MILACDIGTTTVKAGIIDHKGRLKAYSREQLSAPYDPNFSAEQWRTGFKKAVRKLAAAEIKKIKAVVMSGNGPSIVLLDDKGNPLAPVLLWYNEPDKIEGSRNCRSYFLPKLVWLAKHSPDIFDKTRMILPCPEYICYLLTGRAATALPHDAYRDYFWSDAEISKFGLDKAIFPSFINPTVALAQTTRSACSEFAVPQGIPVYCGGPDFLMALLGSGVIVPGRTLDRAGSSEGINHCAAKKTMHQDLRTLPGLLENTYNISGILPRSGKLLEQAVNECYPQAISCATAFSAALAAAPGADGLLFIPYAKQQKKRQGRKNSLGSFLGLRDDHEPHVKLRAVMEALTMQQRLILQTIRRLGFTVSEMSISGGQGRHHGLIQLKADILKTRIKVPTVLDAELIGGACLAYCALGEYSTLPQAAQNMVHFMQQLEPQRQYEQLYDDLFQHFVQKLNKQKG